MKQGVLSGVRSAMKGKHSMHGGWVVRLLGVIVGIMGMLIIPHTGTCQKATLTGKCTFINDSNGEELTPDEFLEKYQEWYPDWEKKDNKWRFNASLSPDGYIVNQLELSFQESFYLGLTENNGTQDGLGRSSTSLKLNDKCDVRLYILTNTPKVGKKTSMAPQWTSIVLKITGVTYENKQDLNLTWNGVNTLNTKYLEDNRLDKFLISNNEIPQYLYSTDGNFSVTVTGDVHIELEVHFSERKAYTLSFDGLPDAMKGDFFFIGRTYYDMRLGADELAEAAKANKEITVYENTLLCWRSPNGDEYEPNDGWDNTAWPITPVKGEDGNTYNTYNAILISGNITGWHKKGALPPPPKEYTVKYTQGSEYSIKVSQSQCGGTDVASGGKVKEGTSIFIQVESTNPSKPVESVTIKGETSPLTLNGNCYEYKVTKDIEGIEVKLKEPSQYTVTFNTKGTGYSNLAVFTGSCNGTPLSSGGTVTEGAPIYIKVTPEARYEIKGVMIHGTSLAKSGECYVHTVTGNVTSIDVDAQEETKYKVNFASSGAGYSQLQVFTEKCEGTELTSGSEVYGGTKIYVKVTPEEHHNINKVSINNTPLTKSGECYVHTVTGDVASIDVDAQEAAKYKVNFVSSGTGYSPLQVSTEKCGGTELTSGSDVYGGTKIYIKVDLHPDYALEKVIVKGENNATLEEFSSPASACYEYTVNSNITGIEVNTRLSADKYSVTYDAKLYKVTLESGAIWDGSAFSGNAGSEVKSGSEVKNGSKLKVELLTGSAESSVRYKVLCNASQVQYTPAGKTSFSVEVSNNIELNNPPTPYWLVTYDKATLQKPEGKTEVLYKQKSNVLLDGNSSTPTPVLENSEVASGTYVPDNTQLFVKMTANDPAEYKPSTVTVTMGGADNSYPAPCEFSVTGFVEKIDVAFASTQVKYKVDYKKQGLTTVNGQHRTYSVTVCHDPKDITNTVVEPGSEASEGTPLYVVVKTDLNSVLIKQVTIRYDDGTSVPLVTGRANKKQECQFKLIKNVVAIEAELVKGFPFSYIATSDYPEATSIEVKAWVKNGAGVGKDLELSPYDKDNQDNTTYYLEEGSSIVFEIIGKDYLPQYLKIKGFEGIAYNKYRIETGEVKEENNKYLLTIEPNKDYEQLKVFIEDSNESEIRLTEQVAGKMNAEVYYEIGSQKHPLKTDGTRHLVQRSTTVKIDVQSVTSGYRLALISVNGIPKYFPEKGKTHYEHDVSNKDFGRKQHVILHVSKIETPPTEPYLFVVNKPSQKEGKLVVKKTEGTELYNNDQEIVYLSKPGGQFTVTSTPTKEYELLHMLMEWNKEQQTIEDENITLPSFAPEDEAMVRLRTVFLPKIERYPVTWEAPQGGQLVVKTIEGVTLQSGDEVVKNMELELVATPETGYELVTLVENTTEEDLLHGDTLRTEYKESYIVQNTTAFSINFNEIKSNTPSTTGETNQDDDEGEATWVGTESRIRWHVYPNPTQGELFIKDEAGRLEMPLHYSIYNAVGVLMQRGCLESGHVGYLSLQNLPSGIYLLKLEDGHGGHQLHRIRRY